MANNLIWGFKYLNINDLDSREMLGNRINDDPLVASGRKGRNDVGGRQTEPVDRDNVIQTELQNTFNETMFLSYFTPPTLFSYPIIKVN